MSAENVDPMAAIRLSAEEMVIGRFPTPSLDVSRAWGAAAYVQDKVLRGFRLVQYVQPVLPGENFDDGDVRASMGVKAARLARKLMSAAVAYEYPILMGEIADQLGIVTD
jgi:hypothetical protein